MKTLIVDDDFVNRLLIQEMLKAYGTSHIAVNGKEAVDAVRRAIESFEPYDLICLDVMMPEMNGQQALREIRALEKSKGVKQRTKIVMTTALADPENVTEALQGECDYFLAKPIRKAALLDALRRVAVIP